MIGTIVEETIATGIISSSTSETVTNAAPIELIAMAKAKSESVEVDRGIVAETDQRNGTSPDQSLDPSLEADTDLGQLRTIMPNVIRVMTSATEA